MRHFAAGIVTTLALGAVLAHGQAGGGHAARGSLTERERAQQMLDRFTFGPRPGEIDVVARQGAEPWLEQQLNPDSIPDPVLERRLHDLPTLAMTPAQALATFPDRGIVRAVAEGKRPYPVDPLLLAVYQVQVAKYQQEQAGKDQAVKNVAPATTPGEQETRDQETRDQETRDQETALRVATTLAMLPRAQRFAALSAMPVPDRSAFAQYAAFQQRGLPLSDWNPREREALAAMRGGVGAQFHIVEELQQGRQLRQVLSERQLQEVMTEFWFNHFNVFAPKDSDQWYTTSYERDAIRPHALGSFHDLLLATAESPAMQVYLDNFVSVGPGSVANGVDPKNAASKPGRRGLNENYGRELMELHTVGVGGGYTQADVTALSAILTGWGVADAGQGSGFAFDPKRHEPGIKMWMGYRIADDGTVTDAKGANVTVPLPPNALPGMRQGLAALWLLAASPRTAHFIGYLLAQRFVADEPPAKLVDRLSGVYLATGGDIRMLLRALVHSPEFGSRRYFRNQVKTPEEFVASALRATATDPTNPAAEVQALDRSFGQPPYRKLEPTGYYTTADHWMNTQALLARLNFADDLTHGRVGGQSFDASHVLALELTDTARGDRLGAVTVLDLLEHSLVGGKPSPRTAHLLEQQSTAAPPDGHTLLPAQAEVDSINRMAALLLGSPEFQVR